MPILNFSAEELGLSEASPSLVKFYNYNQLQAAAYYPNDEFKRLNYMRYMFESMEVIIEEKHEEEHNLWRDAYRAHLEYLGGRRGILEAPAKAIFDKETNSIGERAIWVGRAFLLMFLLKNHYKVPNLTSINNVQFYLFYEHERSRSTFYQAWGEFQSVAHLWAAKYAAIIIGALEEAQLLLDSGTTVKDGGTKHHNAGRPPFRNLSDVWQSPKGKEVENTFAWAGEFQRFGTTFIPSRAKGPLLDSSTTWMVPENGPWKLRPLPIIDANLLAVIESIKSNGG